jgi:hypothetical protein
MRFLTERVWILCAIVGVLVGATPASAQLAVTLNQTVFHPDEMVEVVVSLDNAGPGFFSDVYVGARLPDGSTVLLSSLSPLAGALVSLGGDPRSFPSLLPAFEIPEGSDTTVVASLSFPFSGQLPRGEYGFFAALTGAGTLEDGRIDPNDLVAAALRPFTLVDVGTGLETAEIEIDPSSPNAGDAISIRLSGQWPDGCQPRNPQLRITGSEVRIDTSGAGAGVACAAVLTPWQLIVPVSQLPAGEYRVVAINASQGRFLELGRKDFDVQ